MECPKAQLRINYYNYNAFRCLYFLLLENEFVLVTSTTNHNASINIYNTALFPNRLNN